MWIRVAATLGFLAVALGAFGAHALRSRVTAAELGVWQTGVLYHALHAVALLALALYADAAGREIKWPALAFTAGVVLFAGSLYLMVLTGARKLGMITPFGGLSFLVGWALVFASLGRGR